MDSYIKRGMVLPPDKAVEKAVIVDEQNREKRSKKNEDVQM